MHSSDSSVKPKILNTTEVYRGRIFDLKKVRIDENGLVYEREIIVHPGSAVVLPVHDNGDVTLVRQYREPARAYLLEIPAGTIEKDETPAECARRELAEETGFLAGKLVKVSQFYVSPGFLSEKMHLFLASELTPTRLNPDSDENIELVRLTLKEACDLAEKGEIVDAKTIIGILLASRG